MDYRLARPGEPPRARPPPMLIEGDKSAMPTPAARSMNRYVGVEWPIRCQGFLHNWQPAAVVWIPTASSVSPAQCWVMKQRKVARKTEGEAGRFRRRRARCNQRVV